MRKGSLLIHLHAHLPYVRHPEDEHHLEERWLYEAAVECYIPLAEMLGRLVGEGVDFRLSLSVSPTLLEMLSDGLLKDRLVRYMERLIGLSGSEARRHAKSPRLRALALMYKNRAERALALYAGPFGRDLAAAFRSLAKSGKVELLTTAATHAYLPNLAPYPDAVKRQVEVALACHTRHMGEAPAGIWLPECGYYEGLDAILGEAGVRLFFLESHGVLHGRPRPVHGVYMPVRTPAGPAAFGRDSDTSMLLWCAKSGYPSDPLYREFHSDIGHSLPIPHVRRFVHPGGLRMPTGIKYHGITGQSEKRLYRHAAAMGRAREHAEDFVGRVRGTAEGISSRFGFSPLVTLAFDAELLGHWWFEGVDWLEHVLRLAGGMTVTPSGFLGECGGLDTISPVLSSWGEGGYGGTWSDISNRWAIGPLLRAAARMEALKGLGRGSGLQGRAVRQAERELLLAQASDWPFLIQKGASAEYAEERLRGHLAAFDALYGMAVRGGADEGALAMAEPGSPIFPDIGTAGGP